MARHAQPIELAKFKGADKKDPQRYRKETPKRGDDLGEPPAHLSEGAKAIWLEIERYCLPGVITGAERFIFEILSNLLSEYRENPYEFEVGKYAQMIGCFARLGMSPADRSKLGLEKKKDTNDFNDF